MMFTTMADHQVRLRHESSLVMESRWKTSVERAPNCPRCSSSNTKFCYYNNYSFSQPRYFCKGCRRYWTKGGSLRNVPVGGGCRKSRRGKSVKNTHNVLVSALNQTCQPENVEIAHSNRTIAGSDIDLAAVFANFLHNQRSSFEPEIAKNSGHSSPECQISPDLIGNQSDLSLEEIPWLVQEEQGDREVLEDIKENDDKITFEFQSFLEQEMATENDFWSDSMLHVPELQSFPTTDDHSGSFVGFNLCSYDLFGFEGFSRPWKQ